MATGTDLQTDYLALLEARAELVERIYASRIDPNVLIRKAKDRGVIGSLQATAPVAPQQRRKEEAEHLVKLVVDAASKDGSSKVFAFLQLLEESSLHDAASLLSSKLSKRRSEQQSTPPRGHAELPKVKPLNKAEPESGVVVEMSSLALDSPSPKAAAWGGRRQLATAGSGPSLLPGGAAVYAEQERAENISVNSESEVTSVEDTQPHSEESSAALGASSFNVLPETISMLQTNRDLQAKLAEKTNNEQELKKELDRVVIEKRENEEKLKETEKQLEKKKSEIKELKAEMGRLQEQLKREKETNALEKKTLEEKIAYLKQQLKEKEEQFHQEKFDLMSEKHKLEIKIEKMHTKEERLKRLYSEEKCKVAELRTQAVEEKTEQALSKLKDEYEQQLEKERQSHRNSVTVMEKELEKLRKQNSDVEPDTS